MKLFQIYELSEDLFEGFEDADADLFMSTTASLTTTTTSTTTTTTTTTTTSTTTTTTTSTTTTTTTTTTTEQKLETTEVANANLERNPERMDSRLRVLRPPQFRKPSFDLAAAEAQANLDSIGRGRRPGLFGRPPQVPQVQPVPSASNNQVASFRPVFEIPSSLARGGGGADVYCKVCDGENASDCRNRQPGMLPFFNLSFQFL